ncbi:MAG: fumarylacetoacetate hydrolase family protein, partial [Planctomycetia bacterium]|nr:fumarylacetoacetate hydrolase family protein [Planctomycetia bacterium]
IDAMDYIYGFTCGNDVSARDWQKEKPAGQWFLGKSFDTFAPVGPRIVPKEELTDPNNLHIESRLNGKVMQSSSTKHFIYPLERLVSYISSVMTLMPGDLIFTGTPGGVGDMRKPPVYMKDGDIIEVEIEQIGVLKNHVVADTK